MVPFWTRKKSTHEEPSKEDKKKQEIDRIAATLMDFVQPEVWEQKTIDEIRADHKGIFKSTKPDILLAALRSVIEINPDRAIHLFCVYPDSYIVQFYTRKRFFRRKPRIDFWNLLLEATFDTDPSAVKQSEEFFTAWMELVQEIKENEKDLGGLTQEELKSRRMESIKSVAKAFVDKVQSPPPESSKKQTQHTVTLQHFIMLNYPLIANQINTRMLPVNREKLAEFKVGFEDKWRKKTNNLCIPTTVASLLKKMANYEKSASAKSSAAMTESDASFGTVDRDSFQRAVKLFILERPEKALRLVCLYPKSKFYQRCQSEGIDFWGILLQSTRSLETSGISKTNVLLKEWVKIQQELDQLQAKKSRFSLRYLFSRQSSRQSSRERALVAYATKEAKRMGDLYPSSWGVKDLLIMTYTGEYLVVPEESKAAFEKEKTQLIGRVQKSLSKIKSSSKKKRKHSRRHKRKAASSAATPGSTAGTQQSVIPGVEGNVIQEDASRPTAQTSGGEEKKRGIDDDDVLIKTNPVGNSERPYVKIREVREKGSDSKNPDKTILHRPAEKGRGDMPAEGFKEDLPQKSPMTPRHLVGGLSSPDNPGALVEEEVDRRLPNLKICSTPAYESRFSGSDLGFTQIFTQAFVGRVRRHSASSVQFIQPSLNDRMKTRRLTGPEITRSPLSSTAEIVQDFNPETSQLRTNIFSGMKKIKELLGFTELSGATEYKMLFDLTNVDGISELLRKTNAEYTKPLFLTGSPKVFLGLVGLLEGVTLCYEHDFKLEKFTQEIRSQLVNAFGLIRSYWQIDLNQLLVRFKQDLPTFQAQQFEFGLDDFLKQCTDINKSLETPLFSSENDHFEQVYHLFVSLILIYFKICCPDCGNNNLLQHIKGNVEALEFFSNQSNPDVSEELPISPEQRSQREPDSESLLEITFSDEPSVEDFSRLSIPFTDEESNMSFSFSANTAEQQFSPLFKCDQSPNVHQQGEQDDNSIELESVGFSDEELDLNDFSGIESGDIVPPLFSVPAEEPRQEERKGKVRRR